MKKHYLYITLLFAFILIVNFAHAYYPTAIPWTMDRHDVAHTGTTTSTAPNTNTTLWTYAYPGTISTPIVVDGKVIFSLSSKIYAADETTGAKLWESPSLTSLTGSPTYAEGKIYITSSTGYLYCIDADTGAKLWEYDARPGTIYTNSIVYNGKAFFGISDASGNYLYAINASTSIYIWRYQTPEAIRSSPAIDEDLLYFGCDDGKVYALNHTGSLPALKWYYTTQGYVRSTPTVAYGMVLFGSNYIDHAIFSLNATTGTLIWKYQFLNSWSIDNSLAASDGMVYCTPSSGNKAYALRANVTQGLNYSENDPSIKYWSHSLDSYYPTDPTMADNKMFVASSYVLYALDTSDGHRIWTCTFSPYTPGNSIIADGRLFVSTSNNLYCFGEPFGPVTYHYTVNAGGQDWDIKLAINATPSQFNTTNLTTLKKITYKLEGIPSTTGMSNITIPNNLLGGPYTVTVDGALPTTGPDTVDDGNYTSLYFTYFHSTHAVEIIGTTVLPEYQWNLLLPLLIAASLIAAILAKKQR